MSEAKEGEFPLHGACINTACGGLLYGAVVYCPYCGTHQQAARPEDLVAARLAPPRARLAGSQAAGEAPAPAAAPSATRTGEAPAEQPAVAASAPTSISARAPTPASRATPAPTPPPGSLPAQKAQARSRLKYRIAMAAAALGTIGYLGSQWWTEREPDTCQDSLDEAYKLEKKGEARQARAKLNLALNACTGPQLDKAKVLDRSLQPVIRALEACDRARRDAEVQMSEGRLKPAQKLLIAQPTQCASRPDIVALRQAIDQARKTAIDTIQSARNKALDGRIDEARSLVDEAEQLDRDNPDIASLRKTIELKSRELAAQGRAPSITSQAPSASRDPSATPSPGASPSQSPGPSPSAFPSASPAPGMAPATSPSSVPPAQRPAAEASPTAPATAPSPATLPQPMPLPSERSPLLAQILPLASAGQWAKLDNLVQTLRFAISVQPGDRRLSRAGNAEGLQLLRNGHAAAAALVFRRAWAADPSDVEVVNNLGYALMQAGQMKDALATLEQVIAMAPDRINAWANYAEALAMTGNESGAAAALRVALRYSTDRQKTVDAFLKVREANPRSSYSRVIYTVLGDMDSIPRGR